MNTVYGLLASLVLVLLISSCSKKESAPKDIVLETARSFEEIADRELADGKRVFGQYCSVCHGEEGRGDGFNAYNLDPKPRDFTDSTYRAKLDSALIVEAITLGGVAVGHSALMPGWGRTISETDIRNVSLYVMHLSKAGTE